MHNQTNYPLYEQVADQMRSNLVNEKWLPGQKIPTEYELCDLYHVSRITVRKAIENLVKERLLVKKPPKGTFVELSPEEKDEHFTIVKGFTQELFERGIEASTISATISVEHADNRLAKYLAIKPGEKVLLLQRVRGSQSDPFAYFKTYFTYSADFSLTLKSYYDSFYSYLRSHDINIHQDSEYIEAIMPTVELLRLLPIKQNTPLLKRVRFTSDSTNNFHEYSECYYIGNKYRYYLDFNREK